jgi:superfamily II DNA/RNA helicase
MTFSELGLSSKVLAAIEAAGYTEPTPIQAKAIPFAVAGQDVLGIAQTGTGKTASFVLPMLTRLEQGRARARMPRSLILCPTRELAAQVAETFERYGINHKLNVALLIGGVSFDEQNKKLDRGADVLIATPGRLMDHFQRGKLLMTGVEILVIDEADRMLDMGFIPDIEKICSFLPTTRQTLFFSATMPTEIQRLVDRFLRSPEKVEAAPQATTASTITQRFRYVDWDPKQKRDVLRQWIREEEVKNAIIFCNRKTDVDILYKSLSKHGFNVGCLHGDMDQHRRTATLDGFRNGSISLLAASDVAARGLDIPDVSHVFNFDVPVHAEDYVHRIGRTGRAGKKGFSATLVTSDDLRTLKEIEKMVKVPLEWVDGPPPEGAEEGAPRGRRGRPARGAAARTPDRAVVRRRGEGRSDGASEGRGERPARRPRAPRPESIAGEGAQPVLADPALPVVPGLGDQPALGGPGDGPVRVGAREPRERLGRPAGARRGRRPGGEERTVGAGGGAEPARERPVRDKPERERPERERPERERPERAPDERRPERARAEPRDRVEPAARMEPVRGGIPAVRTARRPADDDGPAVRGLGDHVPDFLRRPIKPRPVSDS